MNVDRNILSFPSSIINVGIINRQKGGDGLKDEEITE